MEQDPTQSPPKKPNLSVFGRPPAFTTAMELDAKAQEFFTEWKEQNRPVMLVGLAVYLGITRETLSVYARGDYDTETEIFSEVLKKVKDYIENEKWERGLRGEYNARIVQFDLENNHGHAERKAIGAAEGMKPINQPDVKVVVTKENAAAIYAQMCKETE